MSRNVCASLTRRGPALCLGRQEDAAGRLGLERSDLDDDALADRLGLQRERILLGKSFPTASTALPAAAIREPGGHQSHLAELSWHRDRGSRTDDERTASRGPLGTPPLGEPRCDRQPRGECLHPADCLRCGRRRQASAVFRKVSHRGGGAPPRAPAASPGLLRARSRRRAAQSALQHCPRASRRVSAGRATFFGGFREESGSRWPSLRCLNRIWRRES